MDSCSSSGWPSSCFSLLRSCWVVCSAVGVMDVGVGAGRWLSGGQALAAAGAVDAAAGAGVAVDFPAEAAASAAAAHREVGDGQDRSEEHTSELQSLMRISYAVFCLKKKQHKTHTKREHKHTSITHLSHA